MTDNDIIKYFTKGNRIMKYRINKLEDTNEIIQYLKNRFNDSYSFDNNSDGISDSVIFGLHIRALSSCWNIPGGRVVSCIRCKTANKSSFDAFGSSHNSESSSISKSSIERIAARMYLFISYKRYSQSGNFAINLNNPI